MNILVFEFITGGSFCNQEFPDSLLEEGLIMLKALVEDLLRLNDVQLYVPLDWRLNANDLLPSSDRLHIFEIAQGKTTEDILSDLLADCDAVWPIAPESDHILSAICKFVEEHNKILLSSSSQATELTGDKLATYLRLNQFEIPAVPTARFSYQTDPMVGEWVLKPVDGVGCEGSYIIRNQHDFQRALQADENRAGHVIQPYIIGQSLSLSCLFKYGRGWLLCCNRQEIEIEQNGFSLTGCQVNFLKDRHGKYRKLVERIARAIPGLWGYVGIDLIEAEQGPLVLEINPRLTTSFAGLRIALGFNVAEQVLQLIDADPELIQTQSRQINIKIPGKQKNAS